MTESPVRYRPLLLYAILIVILLVGNTMAGLAIGLSYLPLPFDIWVVTLLFLVLPTLSTAAAFAVGYRAKKVAVDYDAPEWDYQPAQFSVEDVRDLVRAHHRKYARLESRSNYWFFHLPIITIILIYALPFYVAFQDSSTLPIAQLILPIGLALNGIVAAVGAFLAASNEASKDFTLPLIREALWLAREQSKAKGVSQIRVIMDRAEVGEFKVFQNPRVILRLDGFENEGYIESWSEDLKAITRLLCRLHEAENHGQVIWWWQSHDRNFRKYTSSDDEGYYVRTPIPSLLKELGVRDVVEVTENAVAIFLLEVALLEGRNDKLQSLLSELG
ncbi:MAG: hypothetical protein ACFFD9_06715, partial [Candidatus Thorarchaeota archaeon]